MHGCLGQLSKGPCEQNLQKPSSCHCCSQKVYFCSQHVIYSHGQTKPAYFVAVGIPIWDMMETPLEARKCLKTCI
jgi:hypothetical protein